MQFLHPKNWAPTRGFSNGVAVEGRQVFVAGQVGWNARQEIVDDDFVAQVEQALRNVVEILAEADARPEHLVRLTGTSPTSGSTSRACARWGRPTGASSAGTFQP